MSNVYGKDSEDLDSKVHFRDSLPTDCTKRDMGHPVLSRLIRRGDAVTSYEQIARQQAIIGNLDCIKMDFLNGVKESVKVTAHH